MNTIIYIGGFELPDKNAAAQRVISNAKALSELGYKIVLVDIDRSSTKNILETQSECFGFTRYSMRYTNKRLTSIDDFVSVVDCYKTDKIKVIAYNYPGIALWKMHRYCKNKGLLLYADCTEWYGMLGDNVIKRLIKGGDSFIRMNIVQPKLDGMIAISRYLENFYKDKLPTICIPPLTDITEGKWKEEEFEKHDGIRIVYAGNPGKHKDKINRIIEALSKIDLEVVQLFIVGISKNQFLEYYPEDKILLESLGEKVCFKGRISHEEVIHMLKQADFSMFYRDITRVTMAGFPTKFSEAITCGTPVITNRTSDLEEYLIEGKNGYWVTDDLVNSFKKIISQNSHEEIRSLVDRQLFDYHNYLKKMKSLFCI